MTPTRELNSLGGRKVDMKKLPPGETTGGSFFMEFFSKGLSRDLFHPDSPYKIKALLINKDFQLSEGEIHYLYWFIQGSIMVPDIRHRLRRAWGFCERHAWGYLLVEASFYRGYMHGAALLYEDLMSPALSAFPVQGPLKNWRLVRNLNSKGPCPMCEMGFGPRSKGMARPELIEKGRDATELVGLARITETYWVKTICGRCAENRSLNRCRRHLIEDILAGEVDRYSEHISFVEYIFYHLCRYHRSFRLEFQGTETEEDIASLISAVGWCSGWKTFFSIYGENIFR